MVSAELVLAGVSIGALSVEIVKGSIKATEILEDYKKFADESGALQRRLGAAITRFKSLKAILIGPGELSNIPPDCFYLELGAEAKFDVYEALQRLESLISVETKALQDKYGVENGAYSPGQSRESSGGLSSSVRWSW